MACKHISCVPGLLAVHALGSSCVSHKVVPNCNVKVPLSRVTNLEPIVGVQQCKSKDWQQGSALSITLLPLGFWHEDAA